MPLHVLDTDHISLHQREHLPLKNRLRLLSKDDVVITVISVEEQMKGRLAYLNRQGVNLAQAYALVAGTAEFFCKFRILPFRDSAREIYEDLHRQKIRVGKLDLRIAAIVIDQNAILLTRNRKDFELVPGLRFEDWSI